MPLSIGQILHSHYQIQSLLGQGGMGAVYRAMHTSLNRVCAIKENLDISPAAQAQFQREAQILAQLRHPHLPQVFEYFIEPNGRQYLVMEFIAGEDLQTVVQRGGPLSESQAVTFILQILDALDYLHTRVPPVIHRDIKPANIRITPEGLPILVDFGIAKVWTTGQMTTAGARAVTPGYSPPEQYGQGATDTRSDLYALGATLYFILTAKEPCEAVQRLSGASLKLPRMLNPALTPQIEQVIMRAMDLAPQNRYQSARALREALATPQAQALVKEPSGRPMGAANTLPVTQSVQVPSISQAVPVVPSVVRPRRARPWLAPVLVGNALGLLLNLGADLGNVNTGGIIHAGLLFIFCGLLLLVPFAMGWWGAQRARRSEGQLNSRQALGEGARIGFLCSAINLVAGLLFVLAALSRPNAAGTVGLVLLVSLVGVVAYVAVGAAGGAFSQARARR